MPVFVYIGEKRKNLKDSDHIHPHSSFSPITSISQKIMRISLSVDAIFVQVKIVKAKIIQVNIRVGHFLSKVKKINWHGMN